MTQEGSYKISNFAVNVDNEIRRLKAQVELFWEKELKLLRMFGLRDGMRILECGSGPGHLMEKLLQSHPSSHVAGVEIDPYLIQKCKELLAPLGGDRFQVFEQSIMSMEFADESFDFVIGRLVLEHLPDPVRAAKEAFRILKVNGKAVFIDNDFDMHLKAFPDIPELDDLYKAYCKRRSDDGGNPRIGRELPGVLQEAGFSNVDLEVVTAHSRVIGDEPFLKSEGSGIPAQLVKDGYLSRDIMDKLVWRWHDALKQKHHVFFRQLFVAVGEKCPPRSSRPKMAVPESKKARRDPLVREILNAGATEEKARLLSSYIRVQIASSLRISQESIGLDVPLIDLGVDSIMAVELVNRIATDFGITVPAVDILESQSILSSASNLASRIDGQEPSGAEGSGPAPDKKNEGDGADTKIKGALLDEGDWEDGEI